MSGRGRRYETGSPKLNIKKVIATILMFVVIILVIISMKKLFTSNDKLSTEKVSSLTYYFSSYHNEKWGVIDSTGKEIISNEYNEMIIVPDSSKDLFICTYGVDEASDKYNTKVLNKENTEILTNYSNVQAIENTDGNDVWYENDILKFEKDGKYGLIDFDGKLILEAEYDNIYALNGIEKNIIIEKDGEYGLVNTSMGEVIIKPEFDEITTLAKTSYENGYIVKKDGKYGVISADSKVIFENVYDKVQNVASNEYYVVLENGVNKIINSSGATVTELNYENAESINGTNVVVSSNGKYGIINLEGSVIIEPEYDDLKYAFEEYYIAKKDNLYGVINTSNEVRVEFKYSTMAYIKSADFIEADNSNYKTDIINRKFEVVLADVVISELNLDDGYMRIRKDSEYKYYNFNFEEKTAQEVLVSNTLFLVKENGKYGYENKNGERVVDCIYDDAKEQNKYGYCAVKKDGVWGDLKSDGTVEVSPRINLDEFIYVDFIGTWYLDKNLELNTYTK